MKVVVDMNLTPLWVAFLKAAGIEAVHWSSVGAPNASDTQIMAWASSNERLVLTHDLDFGTILAVTAGTRPSVIQVRAADNSPEAVGGEVLAALRQMAVEIYAGALITVEPGRSRLRILPLARRAKPT